MTHSNEFPDQRDDLPSPPPNYFGPPPSVYPAPPVAREMSDPDIYLPNPSYQPSPGRPGRGKKIIAGAAALALLAGGAIAAYAYSVLASGGIQPDRVLPNTTVAFAELDLDPAAGQKIALYRLSAKFPALSKGASNIDDERNSILSTLIGHNTDLDYATEVKPWLGDRIAVAAVPDASSDAGLDPVVALAFTDEAKMKATLSKAARTQKDFGYVTTKNYVLMSDSQPHAEAVLAGLKGGTLAGSRKYQADLRSLGGSQFSVAWADFEAIAAALKSRDHSGTSDLSLANSLFASTGRIIVGAHATSDFLEVSARILAAPVDGAAKVAGKAVNGTLARLAAADTSAAIEVSGLGDALTQAWTHASTSPNRLEQFQSLIDEYGLQLPADLTALFGSDATISVNLPHGASGEPEIAAQVSTSGAARATQLIDMLSRSFLFSSDSVHTQRTTDGYLLSNSPSYDPRARAGAPTLGDDPAFRKAVPHAASASLIGYLNLGSILDSDQQVSAKQKTDYKHVGSLGLSMTPTPDGSTITVRLTTR
ncbi:MAG: hypothetical protein QOI26_1520 [Pseudonocardiales bacterium]|jgi:hypothetical protein|nr:hypothetical protein [Pseudonocardiales bacterium]